MSWCSPDLELNLFQLLDPKGEFREIKFCQVRIQMTHETMSETFFKQRSTEMIQVLLLDKGGSVHASLTGHQNPSNPPSMCCHQLLVIVNAFSSRSKQPLIQVNYQW